MIQFKKLLCSLTIISSIGCISGLSATAYAQESYGTHFKAYQAAQASGDYKKAAAEARAAWQAAETELGDNELTGILAYNYGSIAVTSDPKSAVKPLKRAKKIHDKGLTKLPLDKIKGYLAYTDYAATPGQETAVKLREALSLSLKNGIPELDDAFMWLNMATLEAKQLRIWNAEPAAQMVVKSIESRGLEDASRPALNNMLIIRASAGLSGRDRTPERIAWALDDLERVIESLGPQKDTESADPVFATALAWKSVALKQLEDQGAPIPDSIAKSLSESFSTHKGNILNCGLVWENKKKPNFRGSAAYPQGLYPGYAGAALISYDISKSGKIENTKIFAQVPNAELKSEALRAFKKWKIKTPPRDGAACRKNQVTAFSYHSEWPPL